MADDFVEFNVGLGSPARKAFKVTKADATDLPNGVARFLIVGTAGPANLVDAEGNDLADFPLKAGRNDIRVKQVETGGTADDIWACY